jgi:hypothetical protein
MDAGAETRVEPSAPHLTFLMADLNRLCLPLFVVHNASHGWKGFQSPKWDFFTALTYIAD